MTTQGTIIKRADFTNAPANFPVHSQGIKNAMFPKREILQRYQRFEPRNVLVTGTSKKERLIEVTLAGHFSLMIWQPNVLRQFPRAKRTKRDNRNPGFFAKRFEGISCGWLRFCDRNAGEAAQSHCLRRFQMEVVFGEIDGAAIFRDEGFRMARTAAWLIELQARMATEPDTRDCKLIELWLEPIETVKESASWGQEAVYRAADGNFGLQQEGALREKTTYCTGVSRSNSGSAGRQAKAR